MKAVIITIYDRYNIGNRLQNYAVQSVLQNFGLQVTTIAYPSSSVITWKMLVKKFLQLLTGYHLPGNKEYWKTLNFHQIKTRLHTFQVFSQKYINTQEITKIGQIEQADYYILGSDQVWNTEWYNECELKKDLFLLTFAKPKQKVCFAPSFGVETLAEEWKPWFQKYLAKFPKLSVREDVGAKIIKEYTGQDAFVMLDPTLMMDEKQWNEIAAKPMNIDTNKPYILTYFLGGRSAETERSIKKYASQLHATVYHLLDQNQPEVYITGPAEFLYLVSHAKLVLTDSFHACVFSFLYGKPFLVYARQGNNSMISRMETLLKKFNIERKYVGSNLENDLLECDYCSGYKILMEERKKALNFLMSAMHLATE